MQCLFFLKVLGKKLTITIKEWIEENIFHDENCLIKWKSAWNRRGKQQQPQWNFKSLVCLVKENILISSLGEAKIYHIDNLCLVAFPEKYSWIKTTSIPIHHFLKKQTKQQQRVVFVFFFFLTLLSLSHSSVTFFYIYSSGRRRRGPFKTIKFGTNIDLSDDKK